MYYISDYALYFAIPYKLNVNNDYCMLGMMIIKKKVLLRMSELQNKFSVFLQEKKAVWGLFPGSPVLGLHASTAEVCLQFHMLNGMAKKIIILKKLKQKSV